MKDSYAAKFFLLTFILSWGAWALLVRLAPAGLDPASPSYLLFMLGGFGPTLVGVFLTAANEGRSGLGDLWRRTWRLSFGFQWYLVVFLLFPLLGALTIWITRAAGGPAPDFSLAESLAASPNLLIPALVSFFIFGALGEEFGWRGYALDRLQSRLGPAFGSLWLGVLWAVWHLPMFFITGLPQHDSGLSFPLFAVWIIALSPIYTWIYNSTGRSLAAVLLFHWVSTITGSILPTAQGETIGLLVISAALLIAWLRRPAPELSAAENRPVSALDRGK